MFGQSHRSFSRPRMMLMKRATDMSTTRTTTALAAVWRHSPLRFASGTARRLPRIDADSSKCLIMRRKVALKRPRQQDVRLLDGSVLTPPPPRLPIEQRRHDPRDPVHRSAHEMACYAAFNCDHCVPERAGGTTTLMNLAWSCPPAVLPKVGQACQPIQHSLPSISMLASGLGFGTLRRAVVSA